MDEMTFLSRKYLACSLCDLHGAIEYAGATTARCSGDQVAAVSRGRATGVVVDPPVQVEDDVVAEAWRRDEEAATSQCSGRRWWQLPVAGQPLPLDRTRVRSGEQWRRRTSCLEL